jgi:putative DNA primase/helicase
MSEFRRPSQLKKAALEAGAKGWHVFPLQERGKKPLIDGGFLEASATRNVIAKWWNKWPNANVGLAPGPSGLCVIDQDGPKGLELARELGLLDADTLRVTTGRPDGGTHHYFRKPAFRVGNRNPFGKGIDIRGDAGYVVIPPSVHPSGASYRWLDGPITDLPPKILAALQVANQEFPKAGSSVGDGDDPRIPVGSRNNMLIKYLGALRRQGITEAGLFAVAHALNESAFTEPLPAAEVDRTAKSALRWAAADAIHEARTDMGNARRLALHAGDDLRYVAGLSWLSWSGVHWPEDRTGRAVEITKEMIRLILTEVDACTDDKLKKELKKWAYTSQSSARITAALQVAQSEREFALPIEALDANPDLVAARNGVLDLSTGKFREALRADYITRRLGVDFDATTGCPTWEVFLDTIFAGNQGLISFMQRAVGYALTGSTIEQCLFLLHGEGANGKSTFLETLGAMFGEYWRSMSFSTLTSAQRLGPSEDLARLRGARFVTAIETGEGHSFNEAVLKQLTGSDTIAARHLYQPSFEFRPAFKLFLAANHKPRIRGMDHAIWRRIHLVPFDVRLSEDKRDRHMPEKLRAELSGIFNWVIAGHEMWRKSGLQVPDIVLNATAEYHEEEDQVGAFIAEECEVGDSFEVPWRKLFTAFLEWCEDTGHDPMTETMFGGRLTRAGFLGRRDTDKTYYRQGLRLNGSLRRF